MRLWGVNSTYLFSENLHTRSNTPSILALSWICSKGSKFSRLQSMNIVKRLINWLETHVSVPAYGGWVLGGIAIAYFGAAVNTMTGWLYVISGVSFALLAVSAFLVQRSLLGLVVTRRPIEPVTVGDELIIELEIHNQKLKPVTLLKITDILPLVLGKSVSQSIETIQGKDIYRWKYYYPTERRGVYRWHTVELSSSAPWGLFFSRRRHKCVARATVYPLVLPLNTCPLIDEIGQAESLQINHRGNPWQSNSTGLVRSLRPYRFGDPTRLVHWRTSARYGELRVRELEIITGGQELIIALDSSTTWEETHFEQAVTTAVSLYFYTQRQQLSAKIWTAATGLISGERGVLETLAAVRHLEDATPLPKNSPLIWLTADSLSLSTLPLGSRWILWQNINPSQDLEFVMGRDYPGIVVQSEQPLPPQLQKSI